MSDEMKAQPATVNLFEPFADAVRRLNDLLQHPADGVFSYKEAVRAVLKQVITAARNLGAYDDAEAQKDTERLNVVEAYALTVHCNYAAGDEAFSVTEHRFDASTDRVWHGPSVRAAIDSAIASWSSVETTNA